MLRSYVHALLALVVALSCLTDISLARAPKTSLKLLGQWSPPGVSPGTEQVWLTSVASRCRGLLHTTDQHVQLQLLQLTAAVDWCDVSFGMFKHSNGHSFTVDISLLMKLSQQAA